jgi:Rieske [2Fe-2S] domain.
MSDEDKYPSESGRRRFVKGVVGGAALAGVGAAGSVSVNSLTREGGEGGGQTVAMAIEQVGGPAPRGLPQVPLEIDSEGFLKGLWPDTTTITQGGVEIEVARQEVGGREYAGEWFQYCGNEGYEQLSPSFDSDNYFLSSPSPSYDWQSQAKSEAEKLHVDDFQDYTEWGNGIGQSGIGKPANAIWRSDGTANTLPVTVLRSDRIAEAAQDNEWLSASTSEGFVAWLNVCTHFCCVPGFKKNSESARYDAADGVYCQCHQSRYDPFSLVETLFIARPRPSE